LLKQTPSGLYCEIGDFFIDPVKAVNRALITHAHADHSRYGMNAYLSHHFNEGVMRKRLGDSIAFQGINYNETININGVKVSFHPAGHIPGSAQIRLEHKGDVWVVTGDYKCNDDGISTPFEPVKCRVFYTESTFALPVFHWGKQENVFAEIHEYWRECASRGEHLILQAYSLGKAQRLLNNLDRSIGPVYCHRAIIEMNEALESSGALSKVNPQFWDYQPLSNLNTSSPTKATKPTQSLSNSQFQTPNPEIPSSSQKNQTPNPKILIPNLNTPSCIISPASGITEALLKKLKHYRTANCSGCMAIRGRQRWDNIDKGFVLSDHADWNELLSACKETGAEDIRPVHGYATTLVRFLYEKNNIHIFTHPN
jgi:putative mRNA 3-end processing factor